MREESIKRIYNQINALVDAISKIKPSEEKTFKKNLVLPTYVAVSTLLSKCRNHQSFIDNSKKVIDNYLLTIDDEGFFTSEISLVDFDNASHRMCKVINDAIFDRTELSHKNTPKIYANYKTSFKDDIFHLYVDLSKKVLLLLDKIKSIVTSGLIFDNFYNEPLNLSKSNKTEEETLEQRISNINYLLDKKVVVDMLSSKEMLTAYMEGFWRALYVLLQIRINKTLDTCTFKSELQTCSPATLINRIYEQEEQKYAKAVRDSEILDNLSEEELQKIADDFCDPSIRLYVMTGHKKDDNLQPIMPDEKLTKGEEKLAKLIGLKDIKESLAKMKAYFLANHSSKPNLHMCFYGNPGTGKTEVARIIANILYENHILPTNNLVEVDRGGLVGEYVGETPLKTKRVIERAMGGVLFIDEAYALAPKDAGFDYGHEAVATLIKAMEDNRGEFCVILAGYKIPLQEMMDTNPGFNSRIQFHLDFPNYSREELGQIIDLMLFKERYSIAPDAKEKILDITDYLKKDPNFANARAVRNILEETIMCLNLRNIVAREITLIDVDKYISDKKIVLPTSSSTKRILSAEEELNELIGLEEIKKTIKKIRAYIKKNANQSVNTHMCFYGNPGTGKTEVARIVSRLLYESGALSEAKTIELNPSSLISKYIGETSSFAEKYVKEAMGGVLFIDEAYSLMQQGGSEFVTALLKYMEDYRGKFCVILAGYKKEIKNLLASNPGFASRIQFELDFPNYTTDELREIALKMLKKKDYKIADEAMSLILEIVELDRNKETFANARTLRNVLDQVIMNQALRTENETDNHTIVVDDVYEYMKDEKIDLAEKDNHLSVDYQPLIKLYQGFDVGIIDEIHLEQAVVSISSNNGGQGTGFIISPQGLCLTCCHCIDEDGANQQVRAIFIFRNKRFKTYTGFTVLKKDEENDIALIQLNDQDNEYEFLPLEEANYKYSPLSELIMAGYPFGGESFVNISITDGKIASVNDYNGRKVVFANMFGKPGNSGSPVIDKEKKKVIGIFWGGINNGNEMIPCFTPIDVIWNFIKLNK